MYTVHSAPSPGLQQHGQTRREAARPEEHHVCPCQLALEGKAASSLSLLWRVRAGQQRPLLAAPGDAAE